MLLDPVQDERYKTKKQRAAVYKGRSIKPEGEIDHGIYNTGYYAKYAQLANEQNTAVFTNRTYSGLIADQEPFNIG